MTKIIGVDIGGTKTSIGIVDIKSGKILKKISIPSKKNANDRKTLYSGFFASSIFAVMKCWLTKIKMSSAIT